MPLSGQGRAGKFEVLGQFEKADLCNASTCGSIHNRIHSGLWVSTWSRGMRSRIRIFTSNLAVMRAAVLLRGLGR